MVRNGTRSEPDRDLNLSPEVAWYLESRGIPFPTCPPKIKTPEPRKVKGARFDPGRVDRVVFDAFPLLQHTQGKWAGKPLRPDPWQVAYVLAPVYGWVAPNDAGDLVRIVRTEYVDVPKRNGKTTLAGGQAIVLTGADDEAGAQVYAVAIAKDQARYCFDPVKALAEKSPALKGVMKTTASRIVHKPSLSYFAVVSSLADLMQGANVHGGIVDELHKHKNREMLDALRRGTGSRTQPLIVIITTADDGRVGTIYAEVRTYCEQLARGVFEDPTFYGVVWAADEGDDPFAEATHRKANPGYGISPTREFLQTESAIAKNSPANLANFQRLHLGIRTKQETKYIELPVWDRNSSLVTEEALKGKTCYGGLDLASTSDLCALAWDFPDGDGGHEVLWRHWMPEARLEPLDRKTAGAASVWVREGFLTLTPGEVVDYDFIRSAINHDRETFSVKEIGYDPWNSTQLVTDLGNDGAEMVTVRQGFATLSSPTKELARLLLEGTAENPRYRHGGNPLMRWQIDNLAVVMDPAGNVKPDRAAVAQAGAKMDGVVAGIMALDRALRHEKPKVSIYETRGLETVG